MYKAGEKVVCIADSWQNFDGVVETGAADWPKKGDVLTVTHTYRSQGYEYLGLQGWGRWPFVP